MNNYIPTLDELVYDLNDIGIEYIKAKEKHTKFNSLHEVYAVLIEEVDELWEEIKKKKEHRNVIDIKNEARHVAAVALAILWEFDD